MDLGLTLIAQNLGVSFEYIIFIMFIFGGLIFFAVDFKLGIIMYLVGSTSIYMWFKQISLNYTPFLIMMFISIILMAFSLIFVNKKSQAGGIV